MKNAVGSSPLARGLLLRLGVPSRVIRIIPARAGFTAGLSASTAFGWDHPRSRGVYYPTLGFLVPQRGSSPLARGLHIDRLQQEKAGRIIPARAGFTLDRRRRRPRHRDHPRSRGVYPRPGPRRPPPPGSSPLARGLRWTPLRRSSSTRIIPARAGFTRTRRRSRRSGPDHPRSRGVYLPHHIETYPTNGSSPLARGLLHIALHWFPQPGIIPARAGFTPGHRTAPAPRGDHPRSRGVYRAWTAYAEGDEGSSPLARGLPIPAALPGVEAGIIPARAGFTTSGSRTTPGALDHPRSRGVYRIICQSRARTGGSSPLARGLRGVAEEGGDGGGIIPARAGFTGARRGARRRARDHPRSRGVYRGQPRARPGRAGSSPLARGLPGAGLDAHARARIIPARAGFTHLPGGRRGRGQDHPRWRKRPVDGIIPARAGFTVKIEGPESEDTDHPRSRGVYPRHTVKGEESMGSSPLARGLREHTAAVGAVPGIIPARAGFTRDGITHDVRLADHPRSRGVYSTSSTAKSAASGSSPLARGLPRDSGRPGQYRRIIPARAGFTHLRQRHHRQVPDHPRSRGVYNTEIVRVEGNDGSSPLARGLRGRSARPVARERIIPARAGFTRVGHRPGPEGGDHPRSRGVYAVASAVGVPPEGSSPLARGLPDTVGGHRVDLRIIPARAGFTRGCRRSRRSTPDHPRSRGVYPWKTLMSRFPPGSSPLARGLPDGYLAAPGTPGIIPARAGFTQDRVR